MEEDSYVATFYAVLFQMAVIVMFSAMLFC